MSKEKPQPVVSKFTDEQNAVFDKAYTEVADAIYSAVADALEKNRFPGTVPYSTATLEVLTDMATQTAVMAQLPKDTFLNFMRHRYDYFQTLMPSTVENVTKAETLVKDIMRESENSESSLDKIRNIVGDNPSYSKKNPPKA